MMSHPVPLHSRPSGHAGRVGGRERKRRSMGLMQVTAPLPMAQVFMTCCLTFKVIVYNSIHILDMCFVAAMEI